MAINLSIGLITPPFGSAMFVLMGISRCSMAEFSREVWPYVALLVAALLLMTYCPRGCSLPAKPAHGSRVAGPAVGSRLNRPGDASDHVPVD